MRTSGVKYIDSLMRFGSVLATLIIGMAFVMITSVHAAPLDKKVEAKDKAKIEKIETIEETEEIVGIEGIEGIEKLDSRAFNRGLLFNNRLNGIRLNNLDNIRLNDNKAFFNRGLFIDRD